MRHAPRERYHGPLPAHTTRTPATGPTPTSAADGRFMMRTKIPNGIVTSEQVRFLGNTIAKYGEEGCADITTRQNFQFRGVQLPDVPEILEGLQAVGLSTIQSGLDNVRNPVGSPLAGIDPHEIFDTRALVKSINDFTVNMGRGNPEIGNLPRKWNVCVVGSHDLYEHPHINDLAFVPAKKDGRLGFNVWVGGLLTATRRARAAGSRLNCVRALCVAGPRTRERPACARSRGAAPSETRLIIPSAPQVRGELGARRVGPRGRRRGRHLGGPHDVPRLRRPPEPPEGAHDVARGADGRRDVPGGGGAPHHGGQDGARGAGPGRQDLGAPQLLRCPQAEAGGPQLGRLQRARWPLPGELGAARPLPAAARLWHVLPPRSRPSSSRSRAPAHLRRRLPPPPPQPEDMLAMADIAERYGSGEIRLTVEQNIIFPNVPDSKVEAMLKEPLLQKFTPFPGKVMSGLVACTGQQFCGFAQVETKRNAWQARQAPRATPPPAPPRPPRAWHRRRWVD